MRLSFNLSTAKEWLRAIPFFGRAPLRSHLLVLVLATVIPLLIFSIGMVFLFARDERRALEDGIRDRARALAYVVDNELASTVSTLQALSTLESVQRGNLTEFYRVCARVLPSQRGWQNIMLQDRSGKQLFNVHRPRGDPLPGVLDKKSFDRVLQAKEPTFLDFTDGHTRPSTGVRLPIFRDGEIRYVLSAIIEPGLFIEILVEQKFPPGWTATVFDRRGIVMARTKNIDKLLGKPAEPLFAQADPHAVEEWLYGSDMENVDSYGALSRSRLAGWGIGIVVPAAIIDGPLYHSLGIVGLVGTIFLLSGVFFAVLFGRRITDSVAALSRAAEKIGETEFPPQVPASTVRELEALRRSIRESGEALLKSARRYRNIFQSAGVSIWEEDFTEVKAALDALRARGIRDFHRYFAEHPEFVECAINMVRIVDVNDETVRMLSARDKAELMESLERIFLPETEQAFAEELIAITERRTVYRSETVVRTLQGERIDILFNIIFPPPDQKFDRVLVTLMDITERKRTEEELQRLNLELENRVIERTAELEQANRALVRDMEERRKLEEQLRQAQKMESVGVLAGGIAHDFNNILNIIQGYASLLENRTLDAEETAESLKVINETIQRGSGVVQQLLTLARKTESRLEPTDANRLLDGLIKLLKETFPKTIDIKAEQTAKLPPVLADPNQITQALLNLCVNARDAMPSGGSLTLTTQVIDGAELQDGGEEKAERYVQIEVKDTGMGIDPAVQSRIFEPFFTTKGTGQGTGLGLAVVYGIVQSHNGTIEVDSTPMRGTTFRVYLPETPTVEMPVEASPKRHESRKLQVNGHGTVLVVEDEEHMLRLLEQVLSQRGYRVLTASDGEEAVEVYRSHKETIDVVLLDIGLPKMAGWDVFLKLKEENPRVNVVIASGYLEPQAKTEMHQAGVKHFIHKPYMIQEVLDAVGDLANREEERIP